MDVNDADNILHLHKGFNRLKNVMEFFQRSLSGCSNKAAFSVDESIPMANTQTKKIKLFIDGENALLKDGKYSRTRPQNSEFSFY